MDLASHYSQFVNWLGGGGAMLDTVLHIHGGMTIMVVVRVLTGRSLATPWPLLAVVIAALTKEFVDFMSYDVIKPDSLNDIAHTLFWPTVLFVGLRVRRTRQMSADQDQSRGKS